MEPWSLLETLLKPIKHIGFFLLKKAGYKIVLYDEYKEDTREVEFNFPSTSQKCLKDKDTGAEFFWSENYRDGYKKYFHVEDNQKIYFIHNKQILWVKNKTDGQE